MKLVDRNPLHRKRSGKVAAFTAVERQPLLKVPSDHPIQFQQYRKENIEEQRLGPCPETPPNKIYFLGDKSMTTRIETNHIYDSVKIPLSTEVGQDWKILTLKQLKRDRSGAKDRQGVRQTSKSKRGIDVSISKRNRKAVSSENKINNIVCNDEKDYKCLRKLSTRGRLIDKIQFQMQNSSKEGIFFC